MEGKIKIGKKVRFDLMRFESIRDFSQYECHSSFEVESAYDSIRCKHFKEKVRFDT